jgi:N-acyl-D-amino-acid deacylase
MAVGFELIARRRSAPMSLKTLAAGLAAMLLALAAMTPATASTLIVGARLVDGTGAAPRAASVRIDGDRIVAVGKLRRQRLDTVVDARGLVLAPGFIDVHSHHDVGGFAERAMPPLLAQGVTTVVVGQDGARFYGAAHIAELFAKAPPSVNAASYTGHGFVRSGAMGDDYKRLSTPAEVAKMQAMLQTDLDAGSLGLSTGLEYDPGIYSDTAEIIALARTAAAAGGRYISHLRSEDVAFDAALGELLEIGRVTGIPVQATHLKLAIVDRWGQAPAVLARLDKARADGVKVTADVYPYEYWQSSLTVLFPKRDFNDRAAAAFALTSLSTPEGMLIAEYAPDPALVGKTIAQIATARGQSPPDTYLALIRDAEAYAKANPGVTRVEAVIGTSMAAKDVADFTAWPWASISSDGMLLGLHPRGKGAFAKVLRLYVREEKRLTLAEAVRKMTSLAADSVGIKDRGVVRAGAYADLVLFDPDTITDNATNANPEALATGVSRVWVNGAPVYEDGQPTHVFAGRFLKRAATGPIR